MPPPDQPSNTTGSALRATSGAVSEEARMSRMVDDLLGPDDGLDPFLEENLPATPPQLNLTNPAVVSGRRHGRDLSVASDFGQAGHVTPEGVLQTVRSFPSLPSLPDQSGIWHPSRNCASPSSPFLPPGIPLGQSPLQMSSRQNSHSRNPSLTSNYSSNGWSATLPGAPGAYQNGSPVQGYAAYGQANNTSFAESGLRSSTLFSSGDGQWGTTSLHGRSSLGMTPPNGQGG